MTSTVIIAIANRKGGTGKSTSAVNLGCEWAAKGMRTLVVDLDTQGHVATGLGFRQRFSHEHTAHSLFTGNPISSILDLVKPSAYQNLSFIPSDSDFIGNIDLDQRGILHTYLRTQDVADRFDRILIDTPPTLDPMLINALCAADGMVVPFVPHHLSNIGIGQLSRLYFDIATKHNNDLRLLGLVPTMKNDRIRLHQSVIQDVAKQFGRQRVLRGVRNCIKLAEAFSAERPVRYYAPKSRGALDYLLLANELDAVWH